MKKEDEIHDHEANVARRQAAERAPLSFGPIEQKEAKGKDED